MSELYPWQRAALEDFGSAPKRAIFADPRLGKTLYSIEQLKRWGVTKGLVTAPKTVCTHWARELGQHGFEVADGFSGTIESTFKAVKDLGNRILVVNDERLKYITERHPKLVMPAYIADESHRFKAVGSERGRAYRKIARRAEYLRILTGTPAPNHYGNLWGQMTGVDETEWFGSYEAFKKQYLIVDQFFHDRIIGYRNLPELEEKLKKWATIVKRSDVFGPDTWQIIERPVELPKAAGKIYYQMTKDWLTELNGEVITGTHALTRFLRFQQITSGFLPTESGCTLLHRAKIDAVLDDLDEIISTGEKAVVFCRFSWEVETYAAEIEKSLKCRVVKIEGSTSISDREEAINTINKGHKPAVCVVQIQAGSTGISLAGATHAMFVSETFSYEEQKQAQDRIYSPKKNKCVTHYRVPNTIDMYIAKVLESKQSIHTSVQNRRLEEILFNV